MKRIRITRRSRNKRTIFVSSISETSSYDEISCLSDEILVDVATKVVPTIPSCVEQIIIMYKLNDLVSYPFEVFDRDHYLMHVSNAIKTQGKIFLC